VNIKSIKQLKVKDLKDKRVLVRCDFDVPLEHEKENTKTQKHKNANAIMISDDSRLRAVMPTIEYLVKKRAKVILMGHLGRPAGKFESNLSLEVVARRLEDLLNANYRENTGNDSSRVTSYELRVTFINDCIGPKVEKGVNEMEEGYIGMLENLRFYLCEEKNDKRFAKQLAKIADIYVNDAFAVSHRAHASLSAIGDYLPVYAGLHLEQEVKHIRGLLKKPARPLVVVLGGAKVETKLPVVDNFLFRADYVLVGGVLANNFLKAIEFEIGWSKCDEKYLKEAKEIVEKGERGILNKNFQFSIFNFQTILNDKISKLNFDNLTLSDIEWFKKKVVLPVDVKIETRDKKLEIRELKDLNQMGKMDRILDIGPKTVKLYERIIKGARTVVWNGPMGKFEDDRFALGTEKIAEAVVNSRSKAIIGGGESIESIVSLLHCSIDTLPKRAWVSTGGGAMLDMLAGKKMPGLEGILDEH